mmetsp:Transcript_36453/g.102766  ORF Transcript_36453/g.102766 Transcript_36453/m.102766 type:complete len:253 (+) Transcript_36453:132-890(+)|eukprot:CAMPEP_0179308370 /NCGR_PEP_ID=MMETSP0797-20121207/51113_1 /TAXON_ID=47934 /ORGANISM="Dinophysis acuminata, Strain DAEP01" /LENGTH=252 /DNA_ID=CAMNT_0021018065 /DNA_START=131 /DNA_END=889 /DNA_ORIENTATION=+
MAEVTTVEVCLSARGLDSEAWVTCAGASPGTASPTIRYADRAEGMTMSERLAQLDFSDDEDEDPQQSQTCQTPDRGAPAPDPALVTVPSSVSLIPMGAVVGGTPPKDPLLAAKRRSLQQEADTSTSTDLVPLTQEAVETSVEACLSTRGGPTQDASDELALRSMSEDAIEHPADDPPAAEEEAEEEAEADAEVSGALPTPTTAIAPEAWGFSDGGDPDLDAVAAARYCDKGEGLSLRERLSQLEFSDDEDED